MGIKMIKEGIGFGSVAAMILSYSLNHSVLWMLFHGLLSWLYVLYFVLVH